MDGWKENLTEEQIDAQKDRWTERKFDKWTDKYNFKGTDRCT